MVWYSHKQALVPMSTAEFEYISVASQIQTAKTLHDMMVQITTRNPTATTVHSYKQSTVNMIIDLCGTKRRKFIDLRHHLIRQQLED